jgi:hypothetical protein
MGTAMKRARATANRVVSNKKDDGDGNNQKGDGDGNEEGDGN